MQKTEYKGNFFTFCCYCHFHSTKNYCWWTETEQVSWRATFCCYKSLTAPVIIEIQLFSAGNDVTDLQITLSNMFEVFAIKMLNFC